MENKYLYNGKELQEETGWLDYGARMYQPDIGRFSSVDPLTDLQEDYTPYHYVYNNPLSFTDPTGMFPFDEKEKSYDSEALLSAKAQSTDGKITACDDCPDPKTTGRGDKTTVNGKTYSFNGMSWIREDGFLPEVTVYPKTPNDPNETDPTTLNKNLFGMNYPGGNNPQTYPDANGKRKWDYSVQPVNLAGFPAIGHDKRYDNLGITGAAGLFLDTRAIGADWLFVKEEMTVALRTWYMGDYSTSLKAGTVGGGLGLAALPKTLSLLSVPTGYSYAATWFKISNVRVTNKPTKE